MNSNEVIIHEFIRLYSLHSTLRTPAQWTNDDGNPEDYSPSQRAFLTLTPEQRQAVSLLLDESIAVALAGVLAFFDGVSGDASPPRLIDDLGQELERDLYERFIEAVDAERTRGDS